MERSIHDAICVVKRVLESKSVVPGGGAVEAALSIYLENFATSLVGLVIVYCSSDDSLVDLSTCFEEEIFNPVMITFVC